MMIYKNDERVYKNVNHFSKMKKRSNMITNLKKKNDTKLKKLDSKEDIKQMPNKESRVPIWLQFKKSGSCVQFEF